MTFKVRETNGSTATELNSTAQKNAGLVAAGNISLVTGITISAKGIYTNTNVTFSPACTITPNASTGYARILTVSCPFTAIGTADTYDVDIEVVSDYYTGEGAAIIQVTDPNAGFATGGGWYWYDAAKTEKVNFGFMAKATIVNNKKTNFQGSLLVIRHKSDGTIVRVKSNVFDGYNIQTVGSCFAASFGGKANYQENGVTIGNYQFSGYAEDCGEPGTTDKFGLYQAYSPNAVTTSPTLAGVQASAKTLTGGNIQVPKK